MTWHRGVPAPSRPRNGRPLRYHRDIGRRHLAAAATALVLLLGAAWGLPSPPDQLAQAQLIGARALAGSACIAVAADTSGSMGEVAQQRIDATNALLPWVRANLEPTDQIALAVFTNHAALVLPPTTVDRLPAAPPAEAALSDGVDTLAAPAVTVLGEAFAGRHCTAIELMMISDGLFGDDPADLARALAAAQITRTHILNPNGRTRSAPLRDTRLAGINVLALGDADDQALTYGRIIADLTGQHLHRR